MQKAMICKRPRKESKILFILQKSKRVIILYTKFYRDQDIWLSYIKVETRALHKKVKEEFEYDYDLQKNTFL